MPIVMFFPGISNTNFVIFPPFRNTNLSLRRLILPKLYKTALPVRLNLTDRLATFIIPALNAEDITRKKHTKKERNTKIVHLRLLYKFIVLQRK
ncbi:hypothetical protein C0J52_11679 [Blattella germanica]|nr:hypothetical protein C0J52_11679 [Blattella germanica]